jgi:hypothetical protein
MLFLGTSTLLGTPRLGLVPANVVDDLLAVFRLEVVCLEVFLDLLLA